MHSRCIYITLFMIHEITRPNWLELEKRTEVVHLRKLARTRPSERHAIYHSVFCPAPRPPAEDPLQLSTRSKLLGIMQIHCNIGSTTPVLCF